MTHRVSDRSAVSDILLYSNHIFQILVYIYTGKRDKSLGLQKCSATIYNMPELINIKINSDTALHLYNTQQSIHN